MDGPAEELEPLFDYSRVQPVDFVSLDDDDSLEAFPLHVGQKRKQKRVCEGKGGNTKYVFVDVDEDVKSGCGDGIVGSSKGKVDDEDWLNPPPEISNVAVYLEEDQILKELRMKKQELASVAQSAESVLKEVMENAKKEQRAASIVSNSVIQEGIEPKNSESERQKIIISIQDKDGNKPFRIYKDDKLEKLFKLYADKSKVQVEKLIFSFDGEKVLASSTPISLGLEDDDMIEVHHKS